MSQLVVAIGPSSFGEAGREPIERLEAAGAEVRLNPFGRRLTEDEICRHIEGAQGLVAGLEPLTGRVFEAAPQLRAIARAGIGMDNVNLEAARALGIRVSNTPEGPTQAVAEMTLAAALCLSRGLAAANADLHEGRWTKRITGSLAGATVFIIGMGRIGQRTARLFESFQSRILWHDPARPPGSVGTAAESLAAGLAQADIVSLHASGRECLLDAAAFEELKPGALVLNAARGALIDEDALCNALDDGRVGGVWCDAFEQEPYAGRLCQYPQALLTPHAATYTGPCRRTMEIEAAENLLRDLREAGVFPQAAAP